MRSSPSIVLLAWWLVLCTAPAVQAQNTEPPSVRADTTADDTLRTDSLRAPRMPPAVTDRRPPRGRPTDTNPSAQGALEQPVRLTATDSLIITFDAENGDTGTLYGEANMEYEEVSLQGPRIDMYFETNELRATERPTLQGASRPFFQQGDQEAFTGNTLSYNLRSGRGRVVGGRRGMNEGFVQGDVTKVFEDSTIFMQDGIYSTCDCPPGETPSYSLRAQEMKLSDRWVYSGPIQLYIFNIPMPLWLPFGFLPNFQGRRSGPLPPQYGEDERGLYLRDWGWYFAMNDYMDLQVQFGVWSQGSYEIRPRFRYAKRYAYDGSLLFRYTRNRRGEQQDPDFTQNRQGALQWNHSQTINPTSSFNSNLNLVSSSRYLRTSSEDYNDNVSQEISSSMRYTKRWSESGRRINLSVNHRQNFADNSVNFTLPSLSFSQNAFKPFAPDEPIPGREPRWYERLTLNSYSLDVDNRYTFRPLGDENLLARGDTAATEIDWYEALFSPSKYRRATGRDEPLDFEATHRTGLNVPFFLPRYKLNISPNLSYSEDWHIRTVRRHLTDSLETGEDPEVVEESVPGFFSRREFNTGISASTTFYGIFPVGIGSYQGLRHTVRPSLSFNYRPNFNNDMWGYTRTFLNERGEEVRYDIVSGNTVSRSSKQQAMSFRVGNVFETKRVRVDSTGQEQSESIQLLNLDLSSSYNFAADSLNMSDVQLSARTDLFEQFDVSFRSTFSPYALGPEGRVIDRFVVEEPGLALARLTNLSLTVRTSLQGGESVSTGRSQSPYGSRSPYGGSSPRPAGPPPGATPSGPPLPGQSAQVPAGPQLAPYANFSIPWDLGLDFSYRLNNRGEETNWNATLNADMSFSVTPMWNVSGRTGYDFAQEEFSTTRISINRDLGCWVMSFNWTPFGQFQSYGFSLRVKSGPVQDLLNLRLPRSDRGGFFQNVQRQVSSSVPRGF